MDQSLYMGLPNFFVNKDRDFRPFPSQVSTPFGWWVAINTYPT